MNINADTTAMVRDPELLEMISNNDIRMFDLLYKRYWFPLLKFASQYLQDEDTCEEIVQDLFVHLHSMQNRLKIRTSISSYLYMSLRNRIYNHVRNRAVYKKHISIIGHNKVIAHNNIDQFISLSELQKMIARALEHMPEKYREVYLLHHQNSYTVKKISFLLNRPADTVEKQLRKAVNFIREYLNRAQVRSII